jgi:diketogulonate reductase-like aldo/keto reductase
MAAVAASLEQLQLKYIDLVMIHHRAADVADWPRGVSSMKAFPDNWAYPGSPVNNGTHAEWLTPQCGITDPTWVLCQDQTWQALTELKKAGTLRAIGVSNWQVNFSSHV